MIVSTWMDSTAYAATARASMIHLNMLAIMTVPICPYSLSFCPVVSPATVKLKIMLSPEARNTSWCPLMNERDRRSVTETVSASLPPAACSPPSVSKSLRVAGLRAWPSFCTSMCGRGRPTSQRRRTARRTEKARLCSCRQHSGAPEP